MKLWQELLINGLQDGNCNLEFINDEKLNNILENQCYKVLLEIKQTFDNIKLSDKDCFDKIEKILNVLEQNNILCDRHDFG